MQRGRTKALFLKEVMRHAGFYDVDLSLLGNPAGLLCTGHFSASLKFLVLPLRVRANGCNKQKKSTKTDKPKRPTRGPVMERGGKQ